MKKIIFVALLGMIAPSLTFAAPYCSEVLEDIYSRFDEEVIVALGLDRVWQALRYKAPQADANLLTLPTSGKP